MDAPLIPLRDQQRPCSHCHLWTISPPSRLAPSLWGPTPVTCRAYLAASTFCHCPLVLEMWDLGAGTASHLIPSHFPGIWTSTSFQWCPQARLILAPGRCMSVLNQVPHGLSAGVSTFGRTASLCRAWAQGGWYTLGDGVWGPQASRVLMGGRRESVTWAWGRQRHYTRPGVGLSCPEGGEHTPVT